MSRAVHVFDNGIKVFDDHLIPTQRERYKDRNVHEAEEEDLFVQLIDAIPKDHGYTIEHKDYETKDQPDGILLASKGVKRLIQE